MDGELTNNTVIRWYRIWEINRLVLRRWWRLEHRYHCINMLQRPHPMDTIPTSRIAISSSRWVADSRTSREAFLGFEGKSSKTDQDDLETGWPVLLILLQFDRRAILVSLTSKFVSCVWSRNGLVLRDSEFILVLPIWPTSSVGSIEFLSTS